MSFVGLFRCARRPWAAFPPRVYLVAYRVHRGRISAHPAPFGRVPAARVYRPGGCICRWAEAHLSPSRGWGLSPDCPTGSNKSCGSCDCLDQSVGRAHGCDSGGRTPGPCPRRRPRLRPSLCARQYPGGVTDNPDAALGDEPLDQLSCLRPPRARDRPLAIGHARGGRHRRLTALGGRRSWIIRTPRSRKASAERHARHPGSGALVENEALDESVLPYRAERHP